MKLLKNYVLVAELQKEEKTAGGIILSADAVLDKAAKPGLVIAVGPEVDTTQFKPGDRVYIQWSESMPIILGRVAVVAAAVSQAASRIPTVAPTWMIVINTMMMLAADAKPFYYYKFCK